MQQQKALRETPLPTWPAFILSTLIPGKKHWHSSLGSQLFQTSSAFARNLVLEPLPGTEIRGSKNLGWRGKVTRQEETQVVVWGINIQKHGTFDDLWQCFIWSTDVSSVQITWLPLTFFHHKLTSLYVNLFPKVLLIRHCSSPLTSSPVISFLIRAPSTMPRIRWELDYIKPPSVLSFLSLKLSKP